MTTSWRANDDVIATDLDNELVLLDPTTRAMFTLNATGRVIWQQIEAGHTTADIVRAVVAAFEIDDITAAADVDTLTLKLSGAGLIHPA